MRITFDTAKNGVNQTKHGVSLELASRLEWGAMLAWVDERRDYGENRCVGLAPIGDRLYAVVFVIDNGMNWYGFWCCTPSEREVKHYVQNA